MMIKLNQRQWLILLALSATLIAVYFAPPKQSEELIEVTSAPVNKKVKMTEKIEEPTMQSKQKLVQNRVWDTENSQNLFPGKVKPISVAASALPQISLPPPIPTAPPLPFTYIGKVIEEGKPTVFVSKQQKNYYLKGGEVLEGTYRVDKVESDRVVFVYIPLETEQVMTTGGKD